ncbi:MAG: cytochrome b5-like heme/steroid binding domain-containing protein [Pseudomonadota bacterium]
MKKLFVLATALFWLGVGGFWAATLRAPPSGVAQPAAPAAGAAAFTLAELARHATATDCWMAIDGQVYDLTPYVAQHPADPAVLRAWCGKEATQAYRTKMRGRAHSPYADSLLPRYRVGSLKPS